MVTDQEDKLNVKHEENGVPGGINTFTSNLFRLFFKIFVLALIIFLMRV